MSLCLPQKRILMSNNHDQLSKVAEMLVNSTRVNAFCCGAGFSAESGIATFRDPGGLWDQIDPIEFGTVNGLLQAIENNSEQILILLREIISSFEKAESNAGHKALVVLERRGILNSIITQNVDNLQTESGSTNVIEVHGNLFRMKCTCCQWTKKVDRKIFCGSIQQKLSSMDCLDLKNIMSLALKCEKCNQVMRPDVVMFGESVQHLSQSFQIAYDTELLLVLGTSGVVYPVAEIPAEAKRKGAMIVVINPNEDSFKGLTDIYIPMESGIALQGIIDRVNPI